MSQSTQAEAFEAFRRLRDVNAGRLRGQSVGNRYGAPLSYAGLHPGAAERLRVSAYPEPGAPPAPHTVCFVVAYDRTPVAWLETDGTVVTPAADLTTAQLRQQPRAVQALSNLHRRAVRTLAQRHDTAHDRADGGTGHPPVDGPDTSVLAADPAAVTRTWWTRISADPAASAEHLRRVTGAAGRVLLVDVVGYGRYGLHTDVLDLDLLCTIEDLAAAAQLPATAVGEWLHLEGASHRAPTPSEVRAAFSAAFDGIHASRHTYATAERDRRGWTALLEAAGIDSRFFDLPAFTHHLFDGGAHDVNLPDHRIAVFRRTQTPATPATLAA
ncbi:hypothetical protein [Dactylosporangium sp. NPDC000521]|uniref:hypothetical protein n=1 Tax=Dactylosporangium sp. NPDC000521 TaxID=3363975 RepID=UPI003677B613